MTQEFLKVGDVIKGDLSWAFAAQTNDGGFYLMQEKEVSDITAFDPGQPRIASSSHVTHCNTYPDLKKAVSQSGFILEGKLFVVTNTFDKKSGYDSRGRNEGYASYEIEAQALDADGSYNPKGLKIAFAQWGSSIYKMEDVKPVGCMERTYVWLTPKAQVA